MLVGELAVVAFVPVAFVLTITPGADMALVTATTLRHGSRAASWSIGGICVATIVQGAASGAGLAALLATSSRLFFVLKAVGGAYLVFLGIRALTGSAPGDEPAPAAVAEADPVARFREGFLSNILNPKVALFYLALLPQFVSPGHQVLAQSVVLASIHALLGLAWLSLYSRTLARVAEAASRPAFRRWTERLTGLVLVGLGIRVATSSR